MEARKLLPADRAEPGVAWDVAPALAARLFVLCYPSTECNDPARNRIDEQQLRAEIVSLEGDVARARLTGRLKMKHNFYPGREDDNLVEATFVGYLDFDPAARQVRTLRLATEHAKYANQTFGVAIESVTPLHTAR